MKNYFYEYNKRNIQKFNVSITFSIMQEILKLIAVLGIIFVAFLLFQICFTIAVLPK